MIRNEAPVVNLSAHIVDYGLVEYMCNFIFLGITSLFMDGF